MNDYDALVIGGGPAGLAAGIVLAEQGCRVLLCERRPLPCDKPCGEGLMPSGVALLAQLGIAKSDLGEHCRAFSGIRYIAPSGQAAEAAFVEGPGLGVRRTALSGALLRRARSLPKLTIADGARVELSDVAVVDGRPVRARLVVGADGLTSTVRRWARLDAGRGTPRRWGCRRHFAIAPWTPHVEVTWSSEGIEAYVTPVGERELGVAFLWDRDRVGALPGKERAFDALLAKFPGLRARLAGAEPSSDFRAIGPLFERTRDVVRAPVLLIGDAAGYVDAITGEGLSLAFGQAIALGDALAPALRSGADLGPALSKYRQRYREITRAYRLLTRLVLAVGEHPALVERLVSVLAQNPRLFQWLLSANMGRLAALCGSSRNASTRSAARRGASVVTS